MLAVWMVVLAAVASPAFAQLTTGSVAGTVKDPQGGVIPGATITLINEAQEVRSGSVTTDAVGDFVLINVNPGTYAIEITMPAFKTLKRSGIVVSPGSRTAVDALTLEIGRTTETVTVRGGTSEIQSTSGERSFSIDPREVAELPIESRSFTALASLAPGVDPDGDPVRLGGGSTNIMMDGVSTMDTGSNRILLQMNVESIAEVKVLASNYQAEFGRSNGLQITVVTKSGTNGFHGSVYDVERNSAWNANSKTNKLNNDPKPFSRQRDWGYSIGGPVGRPGRSHRIFFFYSQEFEPRTSGNNVQRFRVPTELERRGDFSGTRDNNGNLYRSIRDPRLSGTCSSTNQTACFRDGGVLGRIPASRLYQTGINILNLWPLPNLTSGPGQPYNLEIVRPKETILAYQPAVRIDYTPAKSLRATVKYSGWLQRNQIFNGSLPGYNDTKMQNPRVSTLAVTANYTVNPTMFLEATVGHSQNELAGCALAQSSTGPLACQVAIPMNPVSNRVTAGLGDLPLLFPSANVLESSYYATQALNGMEPRPPFWVSGNILRAPTFTWGSRVSNSSPDYSPPNIPFPGYFNINSTYDVSISLTKVVLRHTIKTGFYNTHSYKAEQATSTNSFGTLSFSQDSVGTNPCDTSFGFSNAATGCFSSYTQAAKYIEGNYVYNNTEGYIQDNWKITRRLTLDYGLRLVHQQPQYDKLGQAANFIPDRFRIAEAPLLYVAGCADGFYPCSGTNRQAMNPATGQFLGPSSTLAIGAVVPGSGSPTNGLVLGGQGIVDTTYAFPALGVAPRAGIAYDVTGQQRLVLRGGGGMFFDRPFGNTVIAMAGNPPSSKQVVVRYGQLQTLGSGGLTSEGPPVLNSIQYDAELPTSMQWNGGVQKTLPWSMSIDVSYVGSHLVHGVRTVNINTVDLGSAFLPRNQDPTLTTSTTPGATARSADLMRSIRGYGAISHRRFDAWRTYHSIQISLRRRFKNGISFGFNDTIGLYDRQQANARLQHGSDGTVSFRADQADADRLLGNNNPRTHIMKANFIWDLPDLRRTGRFTRPLALAINDWQLSGIWSGATGSAYTVSASYQSGGTATNLTGSADFPARIRIVGDPGGGCDMSNIYKQFNTAAFQGPPIGSVGLDSGNGYLRGCFTSVLDLAIARNVRFKKGRSVQLRVDIFNAPNQARITGRATTLNLSNPNDPVTPQNLPFDSSGLLVPTRSQPKNAGFGGANNFQAPRTVQAQLRFSF